jgi:hypothetical protein
MVIEVIMGNVGANPLHVGRTGDFIYFQIYFGAFKNAPAQ